MGSLLRLILICRPHCSNVQIQTHIGKRLREFDNVIPALSVSDINIEPQVPRRTSSGHVKLSNVEQTARLYEDSTICCTHIQKHATTQVAARFSFFVSSQLPPVTAGTSGAGVRAECLLTGFSGSTMRDGVSFSLGGTIPVSTGSPYASG